MPAFDPNESVLPLTVKLVGVRRGGVVLQVAEGGEIGPEVVGSRENQSSADWARKRRKMQAIARKLKGKEKRLYVDREEPTAEEIRAGVKRLSSRECLIRRIMIAEASSVLRAKDLKHWWDAYNQHKYNEAMQGRPVRPLEEGVARFLTRSEKAILIRRAERLSTELFGKLGRSELPSSVQVVEKVDEKGKPYWTFAFDESVPTKKLANRRIEADCRVTHGIGEREPTWSIASPDFWECIASADSITFNKEPETDKLTKLERAIAKASKYEPLKEREKALLVQELGDKKPINEIIARPGRIQERVSKKKKNDPDANLLFTSVTSACESYAKSSKSSEYWRCVALQGNVMLRGSHFITYKQAKRRAMELKNLTPLMKKVLLEENGSDKPVNPILAQEHETVADACGSVYRSSPWKKDRGKNSPMFWQCVAKRGAVPFAAQQLSGDDQIMTLETSLAETSFKRPHPYVLAGGSFLGMTMAMPLVYGNDLLVSQQQTARRKLVRLGGMYVGNVLAYNVSDRMNFGDQVGVSRIGLDASATEAIAPSLAQYAAIVALERYVGPKLQSVRIATLATAMALIVGGAVGVKLNEAIF